jgi:hypothetical protein
MRQKWQGRCSRVRELDDFALIEQALLVEFHPGLLLPLPVGEQPARQIPEMLTCVVKIDDLQRAASVDR